MTPGQTAGCPRVNRAKKFMCSPRNRKYKLFPLVNRRVVPGLSRLSKKGPLSTSLSSQEKWHVCFCWSPLFSTLSLLSLSLLSLSPSLLSSLSSLSPLPPLPPLSSGCSNLMCLSLALVGFVSGLARLGCQSLHCLTDLLSSGELFSHVTCQGGPGSVRFYHSLGLSCLSSNQ